MTVRIRLSLFIAAAIAVMLLSSCKNKQKKERPNIILILSDDMGYSDLGCYGGEIQTPNLDELAEEGLRFTQFYNSARSCPTRASLMTGLHPHQTGIGHMTNTPTNFTSHDYGLPAYQGYLNDHCATLGELLGQAGYNTLMTGKWHLGIGEKERWPLQRGFDKFYGIVAGACNYFNPLPPRGLNLGNDTVMPQGEDYYTTDAFTDYAMKFIDQSEAEDEKPFFLYLAYNAPHWPLNAPEEVIDKYRGQYMDGWQSLRKERYERMKQMGLIDPDWELTPQDSRDWDELSEQKKKEMDLRMAIYAAQVDRMDQNIGRLTRHLEEKGLMDNTILVFLNDNGACAEGGELGGGPKEQLGTKKGYFLSYGRAWANASNTPYREYKHWVHEGGLATPMIVHWPQGIPQNKRGDFVREYGYLPDIMATFLEAAGTTYPDTYKGNDLKPLQGKSLMPLILGRDQPIHEEPLFWEHEGNKAVRIGKYKLVQDYEPDKKDNWELYNLEEDRTEMHDLSEEMPERAREMQTLYEKWAEKNQVAPWDTIRKIRSEKRKHN